jgi:uncharacterized protein (DUF488 family)
VLAVGHSTRSQEELVALLRAHGVRTLVDVRTVPRSRTNPQFDRERLARELPPLGIGYAHVAALGGLRHPVRGATENAAWRNESFRGFADYMQSDAFAAGLDELARLAREAGPVAIMCAEALRWRCHRSLIADALWARGVVVEHIESAKRLAPHVPTPFARMRGTRVTYPATTEGRDSD